MTSQVDFASIERETVSDRQAGLAVDLNPYLHMMIAREELSYHNLRVSCMGQHIVMLFSEGEAVLTDKLAVCLA
jgi:hypothetical protein